MSIVDINNNERVAPVQSRFYVISRTISRNFARDLTVPTDGKTSNRSCDQAARIAKSIFLRPHASGKRKSSEKKKTSRPTYALAAVYWR